jgi:hypothetical protein
MSAKCKYRIVRRVNGKRKDIPFKSARAACTTANKIIMECRKKHPRMGLRAMQKKCYATAQKVCPDFNFGIWGTACGSIFE